MKRIAINSNLVFKYIIYIILFLLFCNGKTNSGFTPFGEGLYIALIYSKQNPIIVSLVYIVVSLALDFSVRQLLCCIVPVLVILACYIMHNKLKYPIGLIHINIYNLVASFTVLGFCSMDMLVEALASILLGGIFAYCACIVANAVLIRGLKYRLNTDEILSLSVVFLVVGLSLFSIDFSGFNLYFLFSPFIVLFSSYFGSSAVLGVSCVLGLGVTLSTGNIVYVATTVLWALAVVVFSKIKYLSAVAIILVDLLLGFYFKAYPSYSIYNIIAVSVGCILYILMPKNLSKFVSSNYVKIDGGIASKNLINRSRQEVINKLDFIKNVFYDMDYLLKDSTTKKRSIDEQCSIITSEFTGRMCKNCKKRAECEKILNGKTDEIFDKMIYSCLKRGKATILDIPPFIASRCGSVNNILKEVNLQFEKYDKMQEMERMQNNNKITLAEQMKSMADILNEVGKDINKSVDFDENIEKKIIDELLIHNVVCTEAMVYKNKEKTEVSIVIREVDAGKKIVTKTISKIVKKRMVVKMDSIKKVRGACFIELIEQPNFDVVFGEKSINSCDNLLSGDSKLVKKISDNKVIVVLSDGMGSGENANNKSLTTISMIESFYKAGFTSEVILSMVNRLLTLTSNDDYATLDCCIVDLISARCDFIKMGATDGIIKDKDNYEVVSSSSLPIGILDKVKINVESKVLNNGSLVLIVSDGVTDVLDNEKIIDIIASLKSNNPQTVVDKVIESAKKVGATDDISAVCFRLFNKVS